MPLVMIVILSLMMFSLSHALIVPSSSYAYVNVASISRAVLPRAGFPTRQHIFGCRAAATTRRASASSSVDGFVENNEASKNNQERTALLWLSPNRLRLKDNLALTKAAELGPDGLTICLVWPFFKSTLAPSSLGGKQPKHTLTPVEAFGYAAARSLDDSLKEFGQKLWLIMPSSQSQCNEQGQEIIEDYDDCDYDPSYLIARVVQQMRPTNVIVDVSVLDRHCNHASKLRDELLSMDMDIMDGENNNANADCAINNTNNTSILVEEVMDDGILIPFDKVPKALGRSRQGGRALRWSTFLSNTMKMEKEDIEKPTWSLSNLPPPMNGMEDILAASSSFVPKSNTFPSWAQQLLLDWGDISEEEAMRRATRSSGRTGTDTITSENAKPPSSSLTEKGSRDTKLSPYLRWGVISPQRAAKAGVRERDLLWRDWSHVCYGLLGPIRRGDAVLDFMDKACLQSHDGELNDKEEEEDALLFNLWCVGNTGSKLVDAGMRQLWTEGWMPRRIRLLAAACLVEGLGLDWRLGRDWFEHTLIDHDPAINELMWQNAGLCGVDPFYNGVEWETPPKGTEEEDYVEKWVNDEKQLIWPSYLKEFATRKQSLHMVDGAEARRSSLRTGGVYKAARTISNSGVRVAWPGLGKSNDSSKTAVKEGEVMGVGLTAVDELTIRKLN